LARQGTPVDPLAGHLFAFINRRATQIKVLYFDRSGWYVWAKRLEQGRFLAGGKRMDTREIDVTQLKLLLEGIDVVRQRHRYRHVHQPASIQASP
jgi:transposase